MGGAGLGLALVTEIARQHGGQVKVLESNEKGSTIALMLLYKSRATGDDIKATEDGVEYHQPPSPVVFVPSGFKGLMKSVLY